MRSKAVQKLQQTYRQTEHGKLVNRYNSYRSTARSFIRNHASAEDLQELKKLIEEKTMKQTYIITEQAYLTGTNDHPIYQATGIDQSGNKVMLTWEILEGYDPAQQQEDQACDWENQDSAEIIEDAKDYLESLALGGECRQYPGKGCDYIIIKDADDQEVAYAEELVPEDESEQDANWNQPRIDRLVAEIKDQLKAL